MQVQDVIERQLKKVATKKQEIDHSLIKAEEVQSLHLQHSQSLSFLAHCVVVAQLHVQHVKQIIQKAANQNEKVQEIAFINSLEYVSRSDDSSSRVQSLLNC